MAIYDSAWCLERFNQLTGRPSTDDSIDNSAKYTRLSEAQQAVVADMAPRVPNSLYPKVPYPMFPVAFPNAQTHGAGTVTLTGASFAAGATLTATTSVANFSAANVGDTLIIANPNGGFPLQFEVTAYVDTDEVSVTSGTDTPLPMQAVAIHGWGIGTADATDGQVFTFGFTSNGFPIFPFGKARIYPSLASFPDFAWIEGLDYVNEGTQIRLLNNRTWNDTLYWYGVIQPPNITSSVAPVLSPEGARELIVYRAAADFLNEGEANSKLADRMEGKYAQAFGRWCLVWKTQWSDGGALGSVSGLRIAEAGGGLNGRNWSAL